MNKKGSVFGTIILIILLTLLAGSIYFVYLNWPKEPVSIPVIKSSFQKTNGQTDYNSVSKQFYPNMRYKDKIISYSISSSCDGKKKTSVEEAFNNIGSLTVLEFYPKQSDAEINILCSNLAPDADEEGHFVAGEGGPSEVLNSTLYSVIIKGKIALYREDRCEGAKVATHELLHSLGFDHNQNPNSILYPTLDCAQEIERQLITDINSLYAVDSLPELSIYDLQASAGGRYLNFDIEVINKGLKDAQGVVLSIYSDSKFVKDFSLDSIEIGARKILNVENLKLPSSSSNQVSFVVDAENDVKEINENNNEADISLR